MGEAAPALYSREEFNAARKAGRIAFAVGLIGGGIGWAVLASDDEPHTSSELTISGSPNGDASYSWTASDEPTWAEHIFGSNADVVVAVTALPLLAYVLATIVFRLWLGRFDIGASTLKLDPVASGDVDRIAKTREALEKKVAEDDAAAAMGSGTVGPAIAPAPLERLDVVDDPTSYALAFATELDNAARRAAKRAGAEPSGPLADVLQRVDRLSDKERAQLVDLYATLISTAERGADASLVSVLESEGERLIAALQRL